MKRKIIVSLSLLTLLGACAKKEGSQAPVNVIQGTWRLMQTATDDNGNGQLDNSEIQNVTTGDLEYYQYNGDGTGVQNVTIGDTTINYTFTWSIIHNNADLQTIYEGHDTVVSHLITLSANYMTFMNTLPALSWYFFQKK